MASEGYHEPYEHLTAQTRDLHRAIISLMEELEAADWYNQRVDVAHDDDLRAILAHNRDEEKEHASMLLEWIRRKDPVFNEQLRKYLFTTASIVGREEDTKEELRAPIAPPVGSLRGDGTRSASAIARSPETRSASAIARSPEKGGK
jgi:ferritin-like protein